MASKFKSVQDKVNDKNDKQIDNYKMIISFANTGTGNSPVVMSVENDTVIAGGNQFSNFGDLINGTGVGSAVTSAVKSAVGLTFGVAGVSTIPQIATRLNWTGSQKPQFAFQVSIYNEDSDKSVLDEVMKIKQAVYPSSLGESKIKLLKKYPVFKSPLGYKVIDNKKNNTVSVTGTLDVKVGRWLFLRKYGCDIRELYFFKRSQ